MDSGKEGREVKIVDGPNFWNLSRSSNETVIDDVRLRYQPVEQETRLVFHTPAPVGVEIMRRERKRWPPRVRSGFPLNSVQREEQRAGTAALCFLCGQPAATGTPCHAGAGTLVYI